MKVLHILPSLNPKMGGVCQAVRSMINGMGNSVINEVVSLDDPNSEFLNDEFQIYALGPRKTRWSYSSKLRSWLKNRLTSYNTIIMHGLWQYQTYALYQEWMSIKNRPKLFIMPHGMLDPYFQKTKERRFKAIRNIIVWKLIEQKLINLADGILFTCEDEKILGRETFTPYHPKNEIVVGLGVENPPAYNNDMTKAFSKSCERWNDKPILLFLSRIHEKKGVDLLINSYIRIKEEINDIPQLVIAGPGIDTTYGQTLGELAKKSKDILFPGMLSGNAKWGAFYNCEAFILPSHQENFGIAIVEAMACGKAVLITDKVNIWREIEGNNAGFIASDTEEKIYDMMKKWLYLPQVEKEEMGKNAKETFEENFTVEKVTKRILQTLTSV